MNCEVPSLDTAHACTHTHTLQNILPQNILATLQNILATSFWLPPQKILATSFWLLSCDGNTQPFNGM
jgi:hypothetical protein